MWRVCFIVTKVLIVSLTAVDCASFSLPTKRLHETKIVIVGAGASGIAAASRLLENKIDDFIILEAENRYGGRIDSVRFGEGFVDLGSHFVQSDKGNVVFSMASQYQLLTKYEESNPDIVFIDSSGNLVNKDGASEPYHLLKDVRDSVERKLKNCSGSLGENFNGEYGKRLEDHYLRNSSQTRPIIEWYHKFEEAEDGFGSWFETFGPGKLEYVECEGRQVWTWKSGGYATVFDLLTKSIPDPKNELPVKYKIHYHNEVAKVKWDNLPQEYTNKVIVQCSDGTSYLADFAIITVSLGVLKEKAQSMFQPALPSDKLNAVKGLAFGIIDKIFLKFPYRWWPDNYTNFVFLWPHNDTSSSETDKVKQDGWDRALYEFKELDNLPLILCSWLSGSAAHYMEQLSDEEVKHRSVLLLDRFIGKAFNVSVPAPDMFLRSSWSSDPHFRGSYSFRSMETERMAVSPAQLAEPVTNKNGKPVLLFAGEATHSSHYSTVHGAIESGWREAERIIELYN